MGVSIDVAALAQHTLIGSHDDEVDVAALAAHTVHGASPSESWAAAVAMHSVRGGDAAALAVDLVVMHTVVAPDVFPPVDPVTGGIASQRITVSVDVSGRGGAAGSGGTSASATQAGLDAEIASRVAADSAESSARAAADTAETTARTAADTAEATARAAADTAESAARIAGDALKADITYVDAKVAGLSWKQAVRAATVVAGTLASSFANGSVIDSVTLATGNRILIKNQSTASENGIYTVNASGAPTRATDADSGAELVNATMYVSEGTTNADTQWTCTTNATITVGSTSLAFAQLSAGSGTVVQYPVWSPHKPPASANALDVEFVGSSSLNAWPAGWSAASGGDFLNAVFPATDPGRFSTTDTLGGWKGRVAAVPVGDFNLAMYVQVFGLNATFTLASVGVHTAGTIALPNVNNQQFYAGYHSTIGGYGLGVETSSGFLFNWGVQPVVTAHGVVIYVRRVGSNYFYGWTPDGLKGLESAAATPSGVTNISVGAYSSQGGMSVIRWVRVVSSSGARQSWGGLL